MFKLLISLFPSLGLGLGVVNEERSFLAKSNENFRVHSNAELAENTEVAVM